MQNQARREMVAVCMESPLYFTVPLRKRLEMVKRQNSSRDTRNDLLTWVKTGCFNCSRLLTLPQTKRSSTLESFEHPSPFRLPPGNSPSLGLSFFGGSHSSGINAFTRVNLKIFFNSAPPG